MKLEQRQTASIRGAMGSQNSAQVFEAAVQVGNDVVRVAFAELVGAGQLQQPRVHFPHGAQMSLILRQQVVQ